jgi:hypothetical protein
MSLQTYKAYETLRLMNRPNVTVVWFIRMVPVSSPEAESRLFQTELVTLRLTVSQYVLVSIPLCGRLTRYCFLLKNLGPEFFVLSLWGALSDERPGLSLQVVPEKRR